MSKWRMDKEALKLQAWASIEEGLHMRGYKSVLEEYVEHMDPYPNLVSELERTGYRIELDPKEKWTTEWKRWTKHFQILDPKGLPNLSMYYDGYLHVLYIMNLSWTAGSISHVN